MMNTEKALKKLEKRIYFIKIRLFILSVITASAFWFFSPRLRV